MTATDDPATQSASQASAAFSPPAGSVIVVTMTALPSAVNDWSATPAAITDSLGTHLAWTLAADQYDNADPTTYSERIAVFWAHCPAAQTGMTVTVTTGVSSSSQYVFGISVNVDVWTGADTAAAVGAVTAGQAASTAALSVDITPQAAGSALMLFAGPSFDSTANPSAGAGCYGYRPGSAAVYYLGEWAGTSAGPSLTAGTTAQALGMTWTSASTWQYVAYEVRAAPGAAAALSGAAALSAAGRVTAGAALSGQGALSAAGGTGTVTVVQSAQANVSPLSASFPANVTAGNAVVVIATAYNSSSGAISFSDPAYGGGAPATLLTYTGPSSGGTAGTVQQCAYVLAGVPGGSKAVSVTTVSGTPYSIAAYEVAGLGTAPSLDQHATGTGQAAANPATSGATPPVTAAGELVIGSAVGYGLASASPGAPWGHLLPDTNNWAWAGLQTPAAAGGTYSWSQASSGSADWAAFVVTVAPTATAASGAASLSGSGSLAAAAAEAATAAPAGTGTVPAAAGVTTPAAPSGAGTLAGAAASSPPGALSGTGTLTAAGATATPAAPAGSGAATAAATVTAAASAGGSGTVTASAAGTVPAAAALSGTGTAEAVAAAGAAGSLSGAGALTAAGTAGQPAAAGLSGTGTGAGSAGVTPAAALTGTGTLEAAGAGQQAGTAAAGGTGTAAAVPGEAAPSGLAGDGALGAQAPVTAPGTASGTGTLTAAGHLTGQDGAAIAGTGSLTAAGQVTGPVTEAPVTWSLQAAPPRWAAVPSAPRWRTAVTQFAPVSALSLEYVNVTWTSGLDGTTVDPTGQTAGQPQLPVYLAFPPSSGDVRSPSAPVTWYPGSWLTGGTGYGYTAQALIGPGGGAVTLTAGLYDCWGKITGSPESPVKFTGVLAVY